MHGLVKRRLNYNVQPARHKYAIFCQKKIKNKDASCISNLYLNSLLHSVIEVEIQMEFSFNKFYYFKLWFYSQSSFVLSI